MLRNSRDIIARLREEGWVRVRIAGSHFIFKHPVKTGTPVVPHPRKDLPIGTVRAIYRQAGWDRE